MTVTNTTHLSRISQWICNVIKIKEIQLGKDEVRGFLSSIRDGVVLCQLLSKIKGRQVPCNKNFGGSQLSNSILEKDNINTFLKGCREIVDDNIVPSLTDLMETIHTYDDRQNHIAETLSQLIDLLVALSVYAKKRPLWRGPDLNLSQEDEVEQSSIETVVEELDMERSRKTLMEQLKLEMQRHEQEQMEKVGDYLRKMEREQINKVHEHINQERSQLLVEVDGANSSSTRELQEDIYRKKARAIKRLEESFEEPDEAEATRQIYNVMSDRHQVELDNLKVEQNRLRESLQQHAAQLESEKEERRRLFREQVAQIKNSLQLAKQNRTTLHNKEIQLKEKIKQAMRDYIIRAELAAQLDEPVELTPGDASDIQSPRLTIGDITITVSPRREKREENEVVQIEEELYSSSSSDDEDSVYVQTTPNKLVDEPSYTMDEHETQTEELEFQPKDNEVKSRTRAESVFSKPRKVRTYAFRQTFVHSRRPNQKPVGMGPKSKTEESIKSLDESSCLEDTLHDEHINEQHITSPMDDLNITEDELVSADEHSHVSESTDEIDLHSEQDQEEQNEQSNESQETNYLLGPSALVSSMNPLGNTNRKRSHRRLPLPPPPKRDTPMLPSPPVKALPTLPTKRLLRSQIDILLEDPHARSVLQEYAIECFCAESVMCWTDIQYYKRATSNEIRYKKTKFIYEQYLCQKSAPLLLNLPNFKKYNHPIEKVLSCGDYRAVQPDAFDGLFDRLEKQVKIGMFDLLLRFQKTSHYKKLLKMLPDLALAC